MRLVRTASAARTFKNEKKSETNEISKMRSETSEIIPVLTMKLKLIINTGLSVRRRWYTLANTGARLHRSSV